MENQIIIKIKCLKISNYSWTYGSRDNRNNGNSAIKTYKINEKEPAMSASNKNSGFAFRTAESFLNSLGKKSTMNTNKQVDLSKYEAGIRVFHRNLEKVLLIW